MTQHHSPLPSAVRHHSGPAASNHSLRPSPGPSFKDLLRSPLLTHQKPSALFSKKASALPLNLFSWSAAASLGMLAAFSFDAPVQASYICYTDFYIDLDYNSRRDVTLLSVSNGTLDPSCTSLEITDESWTSIDISGLSSLTDVYIGYNSALTSIDISGLSSLTDVYIGYNSALTSIDISGLSSLTDVYIGYNSALTSIDISGLSSLTDVYIGYNSALTSIDISGLSSLTDVYIGYNSALTSIDISGLSSLTDVYIGYNSALTSIDISGLSSLTDVYIGYNSALTSIDISGLSSLTDVYIGYNSALTSIDISGLSSLTDVEISGNSALKSVDFPRVCNKLISPLIYDNGNFPDLAPLYIRGTLDCQTQVTIEDNTEPEEEPEQEPTPEEELDNTIEDILEGEGSSEEKLERVKEATDNWSKEQKKEALSTLKKEVLIGAAKVFADELFLGGAKKKVAKAVVKKGLEKAAKYSPKVAELIKKGESVKGTIDKINDIKDTVDDIKNIKEGVDVIIEETSSNSNNGNNSSNNNINKTINNIAEALYLNHNLLQGGYISLDQAFSGQDFSVPFNLSQVFSQDQESSPRFNALLSADIGFSRFSDSSDSDFYIDGTTTNYGIGLTLIPNPEVALITGLQFGYTQSNSDFESTDLEGAYNLRMFSVHPFIGWDATDSLTVWSVIGYGRPKDETTINSVYSVEIPTEEVSYSSSGDFFSFAGGANYRVWESDLSALSIGLSGSTTSLLDNDSQQGSISAQFSHNFPFNSGQLKTSADLALILSDSGPSATELSGNLNWLPNQGRLSGSTNARVLLFGGDRSEWGIGGSVTLLPGERGEGLSLALRPSFGQTNTALSNLHLDPFSFSDPTELAISTAPLTARFNAELAYGFPRGNHALLTPYTKLSMGHYGTTTSAGIRYQLDTSLDLDLSASHRTRSSGNNDNRLFLQLRSDL